MKAVKVLKISFLLGIAATFLPLVAAAATKIVTVADNSFSPSSLTIQVGDTVEWRNAAGGHAHNVTANNGAFQSETASQFTFDHTFDTAGTVNYRCTIHGSGGMKEALPYRVVPAGQQNWSLPKSMLHPAVSPREPSSASLPKSAIQGPQRPVHFPSSTTLRPTAASTPRTG